MPYEPHLAGKRICRLVAMAILLLLAACSEEAALTVNLSQQLQSGEVHVPALEVASAWQVGFDRRLEPKEDVRQIASLTDWLRAQTGLSIAPYVTPRGGSVVEDVCNGTIAFAVVGTVSYLQANHRCNAHILVRGLNAQGEDRYRAAIVVPNDSPIQDISDLKGRSFAFGAPNSTQGHLIPRLMLQQAGLTLEDLSAYAYHDSHAVVANAVTSGRFAAGAIQDTLARTLSARGLLRILALSEPYPSSGMVAGPETPLATSTLITEALLSLGPPGSDSKDLYHWERTEMPGGYVLARDDDYDSLREIARAIGLLEPNSP